MKDYEENASEEIAEREAHTNRKMDKYKYIEQQKERGIQIIQELYDLNKIISVKVIDDFFLNMYDKEKIFNLEERVRNWQSETMSILGVIGLDLESCKAYFLPKTTANSLLDERKRLVDDIQSGLLFLAKIEDDKNAEKYPADEIAFLEKEFHIDTNKLIPELVPVVKSRIDEIKKGLNAIMPLSVIILSGSTLECILLNLAKRNCESFNKAKSAPRDKYQRVLLYKDWKLNDFIEVAAELGYLGDDVKIYSHNLRYFRNYVHPNLQSEHGFNPNIHTAEICFQVLKAAIFEVSEKLDVCGDR